MKFYFHANRRNALPAIVGICLGVLAVLPLVILPDHIPWLRYRALSWGLLVLIVVLFLLQVHFQSKEDDEREIRERDRDDLLAKFIGQRETAKPDPVPVKQEPSTPPTQPRQPHLTFIATKETGRHWRDRPVFTVNHLNGEAAEYIEIDPIQSARGHNLWIRFDTIPFLSSDTKEAAPSFWLDIGGIKDEDNVENLRYVFFKRDAEKTNQDSVSYPVTIRFRHGTEKLAQQFRLTWNQDSQKLTVGPWD